jgi:hypothetical protein
MPYWLLVALSVPGNGISHLQAHILPLHQSSFSVPPILPPRHPISHPLYSSPCYQPNSCITALFSVSSLHPGTQQVLMQDLSQLSLQTHPHPVLQAQEAWTISAECLAFGFSEELLNRNKMQPLFAYV